MGAEFASSEEYETSEKRLEKVTERINVGENTDINLLSEVEHFADGSLDADDIEAIAAHIDDHTLDESLEIIQEAIEYHKGDPCLSMTYYHHMMQLVKGPSVDQSEAEWEALVKFDAFLIKDWSIYPEVRAVTAPIQDESDEEYDNIRVYIIGILYSCAGSALATFFAPRYPAISLSSLALQILIAWTGRLVAKIPGFTIPLGFGYSLRWKTGAWSFKEQMLATCGMNSGDTAPYSQYVVLAMANRYFYGFSDASSFGFTFLLTLSTNTMGFGLAGIFRVYLVYPVRMLWYSLLPTIKVSRMLVLPEKRETVEGWKLKTYEFFWIFALLEFCYYWVCNVAFEFLQYFDWMAWIDPTNNNLQAVSGVQPGNLGVSPIGTLDWSFFGTGGMVSPLYATILSIFGLLIGAVAVVIVWYTNVANTGYLEINSNSLFDNTGARYQVGDILYYDDAPSEGERYNLDPEKYQAYSLPYWSAGNVVTYGAFFMFYPAMIVYSMLNYGDIMVYSTKIFVKSILHPKRALNSFNDRFTRAQRKYKEVPEWWFALLLLICLGLGIATVEHYRFTQTPVWTIFFSIGLSFVFMVPTGALYATANVSMDINVLFELIIGLACKGNGPALMVSKAYATNFLGQTDNLITGFKTGHYCNIAPRAMFSIMTLNMIANSFVQSGLIVWQAGDSIKDMCSMKLLKTNKFICQDIRTYFNAAVLWGTIGPARVFKGLYPSMKWTFLIGACYPLPFWLIRKIGVRTARKNGWGEIKEGGSAIRNHWLVRSFLGLEWINSFNELVALTGSIAYGSGNVMYSLPSLYIGLFFQGYLPRYYPRWWKKYNYILSAAISVGVAYGGLIAFFATEYNHIVKVEWWGNDTALNLQSFPRLNATTAPEGYFGPRKGEFPK